MYKVSVNKKTFDIEPHENGLKVNDKEVFLDIENFGEGYFHIILNKKSYRAELVRADHSTKTFHIKINGNIYPVTVKDRYDILLEKMGMNATAAGRINHIKAPMPGLIIDLKVQAGDRVNQGDPLLILEAMKMENIIKSPGEGVVKSVKIKKGESVEKNQVLIEF